MRRCLLGVMISILAFACQRKVDDISDNVAIGGIVFSGVYIYNDSTNSFEDARNYLIHFPKNERCLSYELFSYGQNCDARFVDSEGNWHLIGDDWCDWLSVKIHDNARIAYIEDELNGRRSGFVRTITLELTSNVVSANRAVTLLVTSSFEGILYGAELVVKPDAGLI